MDVCQVSRVSFWSNQSRQKDNVGEMLEKMISSIDSASESGKLSSDLAEALKKKLEEIKELLSQGQNGSSGSVPADNDKNIRKELRQIGKMFFDALSKQNSAQKASGSKIDDLFKALDSNSDGKIDKNELSDFVGKAEAKKQNPGTQSPVSSYGSYSSYGYMSISMKVTQSNFSVSA